MSRLKNLEDFDSYVYTLSLNESLLDGQRTCNKAFINLGPIKFSDGKTVNPEQIVKVIEDALSYISYDYSRTYRFAERMNIILLRSSNKVKTMAVDKYLNMYINASFVYYNLKMDEKLVAAVIMHEVLHALFNHLEREKNWLAAQGKQLTPQTHHDGNLAADVEVNRTLTRMGIIDEDTLINEIKGVYLTSKNGSADVLPMESILGDENLMKKLREQCPPPVDPEKGQQEGQDSTIKTTPEWDKGYKDAWNKIAGLIKKYGYRKAWDKLVEAGIVNETGELYTDKTADDIMSLNFLRIKSMEDYINESLESKPEEKGKTYDDGFASAVQKLVGSLYNAIQPDDEEGMEGGSQGGNGEKIDSQLKNDDLDEVDLPNKKQKGKGQEGDDGMPQNIKSQGDDSQSDDQKGKKGQGSGSGGSGKSDEEITDDDIKKLVDNSSESGDDGESGQSGDSKQDDKSNGAGQGGSGKSDKNTSDGEIGKLGKDSGQGQKKSGQEDSGAIGGTGSFLDDEKDMGDEILKDAGYGQEDIEKINAVREKNKSRNNKEGIEHAREVMRRDADKFLKRYLDEIEVSSSKFRNVWKEIMENFLANKTRRAGTKMNDISINWKNKRRIALGYVGPQYLKVDQEPQDINVYVDVSGSMNTDLLRVIGMSLVEFGRQYKYSGINVCPWASTSNGVYPIEKFDNRDSEDVVAEILGVIGKGSAQCGGGTSASACLSAMVQCIEENLNDPRKKKLKDDVHVVITDGCFDFNGVENRLSNTMNKVFEREDIAENVTKNTFWMIYDASDSFIEEWGKEITEGQVIFINSETVINNG